MNKKIIFILMTVCCIVCVLLTRGNHTGNKVCHKQNASLAGFLLPGSLCADKQVMACNTISARPIALVAGKKLMKPEPTHTQTEMPRLYIRCSLEDKNGNMWFGTAGEGAYRYTPSTGEYVNFSVRNGLVNDQVSCMLEDKQGNIWFGTAGGACSYNGKSFTTLPIPGTRNENAKPVMTPVQFKLVLNYASKPKAVICIVQDQQGNLWIGTDNGVYRYDGKHIDNYLNRECGADSKVAPYNIINKIFEDSKGNVWFSSRICNTLYRLDKERGMHPCLNHTCQHDLLMQKGLAEHESEIGRSFEKQVTDEGSYDISSYSFLEDRNGRIWFGSYDSGVYYYDGKSVSRFSKEGELANAYVSNIIEDKSGNIWFGTYGRSNTHFQGNGVYRYDGKTLTHYTVKNGLSSDNVVCMVEDRGGKIWFGSDGSGASSYDRSTGRFTGFKKGEGLGNDNVTNISIDKAGHVWIGTMDMGLYRYDGKKFAELTRQGC